MARGVPALLRALDDSTPFVRAVAARGVSRALVDSARLDPPGVVGRLRPLLADRNPQVRINALRALATFHDSAFARLAVPLAGDADVNVAVQAETTLGVLGGRAAVEALGVRLASAVFALRRQALIALAQADSAAGVTAAAALLGDADWRWRSVAAEVFGAAHDRPRLDAQLADADGRVVATDQMRETLGFKPKYTTAETFADFARSHGPGLLPPEALAGAVDRIAALPALGSGHPPTQSAN